MTAHLREIWQIKHQNAASIMGRNIVMHIGVEAVLNLDTSHIFDCSGIAHDDVARLPDIDTRVGCAAHQHRINQDVLAFNGVYSISAVGRLGAASPFDAQLVINDTVSALRFNPVAFAIFNSEFAKDDVVRSHQKPLACALLSRKIERGFEPALPLHRHAIDVER